MRFLTPLHRFLFHAVRYTISRNGLDLRPLSCLAITARLPILSRSKPSYFAISRYSFVLALFFFPPSARLISSSIFFLGQFLFAIRSMLTHGMFSIL